MIRTSKTGRVKKYWEWNREAFLEELSAPPSSPMALGISKLSIKRFRQLTETFDPTEDNLIHLGENGFSVNHGNVGSRGIHYDWESSPVTPKI